VVKSGGKLIAMAAAILTAVTAAPPTVEARAKFHKASVHKHRHHQRHHKRQRHLLPVSVNAPTASLVFDASTGRVLSAANPDQEVFPASLTKMMTLYLTFRAVREGWLTLEDRFRISPYAASAPPTSMRLFAGNDISVDNLIRGAVTESANDAARVLAENLDLRFGRRLQTALRADREALKIEHEADAAETPPSAAEAADWARFMTETNLLLNTINADGSEEDFARLMTLQSRLLGMDDTVFRNASGLPDPEQVTTAPDMAMLAYAIVKMPPAYYSYFSIQHFDYAGVDHRNHNLQFLTHFDGADGIKTGYTVAGGFNVVDSAVQDGRRLIAIVMGRTSHAARESEVMTMLTAGFQFNPALFGSPSDADESGPLKVGDTLDLPTLPNIGPPAVTAVVLPSSAVTAGLAAAR